MIRNEPRLARCLLGDDKATLTLTAFYMTWDMVCLIHRIITVFVERLLILLIGGGGGLFALGARCRRFDVARFMPNNQPTRAASPQRKRGRPRELESPVLSPSEKSRSICDQNSGGRRGRARGEMFQQQRPPPVHLPPPPPRKLICQDPGAKYGINDNCIPSEQAGVLALHMRETARRSGPRPPAP